MASMPEPVPTTAPTSEAILVDLREWLQDPELQGFFLGYEEASWPTVAQTACLLGVLHFNGKASEAATATQALRNLAEGFQEPGHAEESQDDQRARSSSVSSETSSSISSESFEPFASAEQPADGDEAKSANMAESPAYVKEPRHVSPSGLGAAATEPLSPRASVRLPNPESPWRLPDPELADQELVLSAFRAEEPHHSQASLAQKTWAEAMQAASAASQPPPPHLAPSTLWPPMRWHSPSPQAVLRLAEECLNTFLADVFPASGGHATAAWGVGFGGPGTPPTDASWHTPAAAYPWLQRS